MSTEINQTNNPFYLDPKESFEYLTNLDVSDKTKDKLGLTYLPWAIAWREIKKYDPMAAQTIYKRIIKTTDVQVTKDPSGFERTVTTESENEVLYFTDGKTCHVKVGVTVGGLEYIEYLPVMDNRNQAVRAEVITSTAVNRALQRCFVKACARHGLGLYIYAGEEFTVNKNILNIAELRSQAEAITIATLSAADFDVMKSTVISLVQSIDGGEAVSNAIVEYCRALFPETRLSQIEFTPDNSTSLQRLHSFLTSVQKALA